MDVTRRGVLQALSALAATCVVGPLTRFAPTAPVVVEPGFRGISTGAVAFGVNAPVAIKLWSERLFDVMEIAD